MFVSANPLAVYTQVSVDSAVHAADPHRLITLLFQGAESSIALAKESLRQGDLFGKSQAVSKAIDIITTGLEASLDVKNGGEMAQRLNSLYDYMAARLLQANMKNDLAAMDEVAGLLAEIRGAWEEIAPTIHER